MTKTDTAYLQGLLDSKQQIPPGKYIVNPGGLFMDMNDYVLDLKDVVISMEPNDEDSYHIFQITGEDVTIQNGKLLGDRYTHQGADGEWGMGILITGGARNIRIKNVQISRMWGDGIYIGAATDVYIDRVVSQHNRRQGLSIVGWEDTPAKNIRVTNSTFSNTKGTLPSAGIDIEPNNLGDAGVHGVHISNCVLKDNAGEGILGTLKFKNVSDINIYQGNKFSGNKRPIKIEYSKLEPKWWHKILEYFGIFKFHPRHGKID